MRTSPAAYTPGMLVCISSSVLIYPRSSISIMPSNGLLLGIVPINPNTPNIPSSSSASTVVISPVLTFLTFIHCRMSSPPTSSTTESHINAIFGFLNAFSWMDFAARSSFLLWMIVTFLANLVRYIASSTAESPPPTTYTSKSSKKFASQVAQ